MPSGLLSTQSLGRLPCRGASRTVPRRTPTWVSGRQQLTEVVSPLLERAVLVIGRTGGREQHDLACRGGRPRGGDRTAQGAAVVQRDARSRQRAAQRRR